MMDKFVARYAATPTASGWDDVDQDGASSSSRSCFKAAGPAGYHAAIPEFDLPNVDNVDRVLFGCPNQQPTAYLANLIDSDSSNKEARVKIAHGTTTLAFRYKGGVMVCVDSRATAGSYIASGTVKKVIEINPFLLGTMAGGAADCQYWETWLGIQARLYQLRQKERISVAAASKTLSNLVYSYKGMGLSMGTMICGWDKTGPAIFYVDSDGTRLKGDVFSVGSGSTFAYGVLDQGYHWDLTDDEAKELARRSIYAAGHRDAFSGNTINLYHVKENGWEFINNYDFRTLAYDWGYDYGVRTGQTRQGTEVEQEIVPTITTTA